MKARKLAWALLAVIPLCLPAPAFAQSVFPHLQHEGQFEACTDCHAGIPTGAAAETFPSADVCTMCHEDAPGGYAGREPTTDSDLDFSHSGVFAAMEAAGEEYTCRSCHAVPGSTDMMDVQRATPESCTSCHAHEALDHPIGGQDCELCHGGAPLPVELAVRTPTPALAGHVEDSTGS